MKQFVLSPNALHSLDIPAVVLYQVFFRKHEARGRGREAFALGVLWFVCEDGSDVVYVSGCSCQVCHSAIVPRA